MSTTDLSLVRDFADQYGLELALLLCAVVVLWRHSNATTNKLIAALEASQTQSRLSMEKQTLELAKELTVLRSSMEAALGAAHSSQLRQEERLGTLTADYVRHDVRLKGIEDSHQDLVRQVFDLRARDRHG